MLRKHGRWTGVQRPGRSWVGLGLILALAVPAAAQTVVIADTDFVEADWASDFSWVIVGAGGVGTGGTGSATESSVRGQDFYSGNYFRSMTHVFSYNWVESDGGFLDYLFMRVRHKLVKASASYNPQTQGAITHLDVSYDRAKLSSESGAVGDIFIVFQDGNVYAAPIGPSSFSTYTSPVTWESLEKVGLTDDPGWWISGVVPDFVNGGTMYFGYQRSNTTYGGSYALTHGIDNFQVVIHQDTPPVANAGADQTGPLFQIVSLDGTGSSDDNQVTSYAWEIEFAPPASTAGIADPTSATTTFTPDVVGDYIVKLTVTDAFGQTDSDSMVVSTSNQAPTADAGGDQSVAVGSVVLLDGSGSYDPDGHPLSFGWNIASAPSGSFAVLTGETTATPSFTPDVPGDYVIQLLVHDGYELSPHDEVTVTATQSVGAEDLIRQAADIVGGLSGSQVTNKGNKRAMLNHLNQAIRHLQAGEILEARAKVSKALTRSDGVPLRGAPDGSGGGRDWILDGTAQQDIYNLLTQALTLITP